MILVALAVLAGVSFGSLKSAQGATVPSQSPQPNAATLPSGQPDSEPAHLLPTVGPHISGTTETAESSNWSGYIDTGSQFTGVSAQWVVPTAQPSQASEYSSTWIGIDGVTNTSLIQTGTDQDTSDGKTTYFAWYELLPALSIPVEYVSPGDEMRASIVENSPGMWTIVIADVTSGQSVTKSVAYSTPQTSAEWIEEAPSSATGQQLTLANYGTAQFTNLAVSGSNLSSAVRFPVDMVDANGNIISSPGAISNNSFTVAYGSVAPQVSTTAPAPAQTTSPHGYWLVGSDGGIFTFGSAQFYGSTGSLRLQRPVVGMTPTGDRSGYWLVASDGGIFSFNAGFFGSIPGLGIAPAGSAGAGKKLNAPIVGMVPSSDDGGYFMVASDGGVFAFGDAKFEGSCPGIGGCSGSAVAVMPDATGNGYWLVTATGHVYTFGDASNYGAPGQQSTPVTSAARTADGKGYWILFANGTVDAYGDATNMGAPVGQTGGLNPASAIFATSDGGGYWVSTASGAVYNYGDAPSDGSMAGKQLNGAIIAATGF
jgi:Peptidase A4 family